jgi:NAD(P)-dependent dehydrogenase (short-subunit alcohol dehydrogenase family)
VVIAGPHATLGRDLVDELVAGGGAARFVGARLDDVIEMARAVDRAGAIDILVNNADSFGQSNHIHDSVRPTERTRGDGWYEKTFEALALTCAVVPSMTSTGGGRVINLASVPVDGLAARPSDYVAALEKLTARSSRRWASGGVRVDSIAITHEGAAATELAARTVLDFATDAGAHVATTVTI